MTNTRRADHADPADRRDGAGGRAGRGPRGREVREVIGAALQEVAPAFAPLALTGWIHGTATWNPVSYLLESGRGYVAGDPTDVGRAILALAVLLPLVVVWTATGLRRAARMV